MLIVYGLNELCFWILSPPFIFCFNALMLLFIRTLIIASQRPRYDHVFVNAQGFCFLSPLHDAPGGRGGPGKALSPFCRRATPPWIIYVEPGGPPDGPETKQRGILLGKPWGRGQPRSRRGIVRDPEVMRKGKLNDWNIRAGAPRRAFTLRSECAGECARIDCRRKQTFFFFFFCAC